MSGIPSTRLMIAAVFRSRLLKPEAHQGVLPRPIARSVRSVCPPLHLSVVLLGILAAGLLFVLLLVDRSPPHHSERDSSSSPKLSRVCCHGP